MKRTVPFFTFLAFMLLIINYTPVFAQETGKGVIYNFAFRIDDELITQTKAQNKEHRILNLATIEDMPKEVSDTILFLSEKALGNILNAEITSIVPEEKLVMGALPEHLMYLPANTFNKAVKLEDKPMYININCYISATGGVKVTLANKTFSKVKPKLTLKITAYDKDKKKMYDTDIVLDDFEKLRSRTFEKTYSILGSEPNTDVMTESETLTSDDILRMYLMALEALPKQ
jgi:hypothetical protein